VVNDKNAPSAVAVAAMLSRSTKPSKANAARETSGRAAGRRDRTEKPRIVDLLRGSSRYTPVAVQTGAVFHLAHYTMQLEEPPSWCEWDRPQGSALRGCSRGYPT